MAQHKHITPFFCQSERSGKGEENVDIRVEIDHDTQYTHTHTDEHKEEEFLGTWHADPTQDTDS